MVDLEGLEPSYAQCHPGTEETKMALGHSAIVITGHLSLVGDRGDDPRTYGTQNHRSTTMS